MRPPILPVLLALSLLPLSGAHAAGARASFYEREWAHRGIPSEAAAQLKIDSSFDVRFYHLDVEIGTTTPSIQGKVLIRLQPTVSALSRLTLNLHSSLILDSVTLDGNSFARAGNDFQVTLDRAFSLGETVQLRVHYHGVPVRANNLKGLYYGPRAGTPVIASLSTPFLSHYWWPCKDGAQDKADSVYVDITIGNATFGGFPLTAVSNGLLSGVDSSRAGLKTFQWRHRHPIVPYYIMAAISNYRTFTQTYDGPGGPFPLVYHVFPASHASAQAGVADLPRIMSLFSDRFGPYPFRNEKYGMTELGFFSAIENQTNTVTNNMGVAAFSTSVHELAHQWFADALTCKTWHHGWLNEGFATWAEALAEEHLKGKAAYKAAMDSVAWYDTGSVILARDTAAFSIFQGVIYQKGAWVVHMLRGVLGDSAFFKGIKEYATYPAYQYGHVTTENLRERLEASSGVDLGWFFAQWVYGQRHPKYRYNLVKAPAGQPVYLGITQTQGQEGWNAVFRMPLQARFRLASNRDTTVTVLNDKAIQSFSFVFPEAVTGVTLDPDNWVLKKAVFDPGMAVGIQAAGPRSLPSSRRTGVKGFLVDGRARSGRRAVTIRIPSPE